MKVFVLCGGIGSRMKDYSLPKPLNMIHGKPAIFYVLQNLPEEQRSIYFIYGTHLKKYNFEETVRNIFKTKECHFECIDYLTRGPVETAYIGTKFINPNDTETILFLDNDNLYTFPNGFFQYSGYSFVGCSVETSGMSSYSFVRHDAGMIMEIAEKNRISDMYCCGVYGFRNIKEFRDASIPLLKNHQGIIPEIYMSDIYNSLLKTNIPIRMIEFMNQGNHIGTMGELNNSLRDIPQRIMRICFDLDNTLVTYPSVVGDYRTVKPVEKTVNLLRQLYCQGHTIIIYTARRMDTHKHNIGAVIRDVGKITLDTLDEYNIPYHELIFGKPIADVYVDDRSVNPFKGDYSYMGIFDITAGESAPIVNKLPTNKHNTLKLENNRIVKTGPLNSLKGEAHVYSTLSLLPETRILFPKLYLFTEIETGGRLEIEYIQGIPFYYLYKQQFFSEEHIQKLLTILKQLHDIKLPIVVTHRTVVENYVKKLEDRFSVTEDYPFGDSLNIQQEILARVKEYTESDRINIVPFIHGDFWLSNIMYTFDREIKCFDMKGRLGDTYTTNGDRLYDYAKLYQSIVGYDCVLYGDNLDSEYTFQITSRYEKQVTDLGISILDLRNVTISLISGTLPFMDSLDKKTRVWNFIKELLRRWYP